MRKKILLNIVACLAVTSACTTGAEAKYNVRYLADPSQEGLTTYILDYDTGEKVDSAIVTDGSAVMSGEIAKPVLARLIVDGNRAGVFILEEGDITVDSSRLGRGTRLNDDFARYVAHTDSLEQAYSALPADSAGMAEREKTMAEYEAFNSIVLERNPENPIGYYIFLQQAYELDRQGLADALQKYPSMAGYKRVQKLQQALERAEATGVGKHFADFTVEYADSTYRFSDYVGRDGQYTLVDFWASWCGPCIKETRVIKQLNEEYGNGRGLNVLGVAVWDEPANTLAAVQRLQLPWPQIINAQTIPTDLYGISGIPHIMIIAPDGTIVSRGLQGDALKAKVHELMNPEKNEE